MNEAPGIFFWCVIGGLVCFSVCILLLWAQLDAMDRVRKRKQSGNMLRIERNDKDN